MTRALRGVRTATLAAVVGLLVASCGGEGGGSTPPPSPPATSFATACTSEVLLPFLAERFDGTAPDLVVGAVDVVACRDGYAHVFAVPRDNGPDGPSYDAEQLWLRWSGSAWEIVAQGTGIACSDPDRTPEHAAACDALGES